MCPQKKEEEEAARKKKEQEEVEAWDKAEKEAEEAAKASGSGFNARCDAALLATLCLRLSWHSWICTQGEHVVQGGDRGAERSDDDGGCVWRDGQGQRQDAAAPRRRQKEGAVRQATFSF